MIYPYDVSRYPPFPVVQVVLVNSDTGLRAPAVMALVDSGADATMVPLVWLEHIGAVALEDRRIRSHWGEWRDVPLFAVDIALGNLTLPGVFVIGDEQDSEVILGRNVLNKLRLLLDGPANQTEILP